MGDGFDPAGGAVVFEQNGGVWGVFREVMPQELGPNGGAGAAVFVDGDTSLLGDVTDSTFFFQNGATRHQPDHSRCERQRHRRLRESPA
ncbi:MAG: hypothetical protein R3E96_12500 [Planctomycetota bacterium]